MRGVSPRQMEGLAFIARACRAGISPTSLELARNLGVTETAATDMIKRLKAHGLVTNEHGLRRSISMTDAGHKALVEYDPAKAFQSRLADKPPILGDQAAANDAMILASRELRRRQMATGQHSLTPARMRELGVTGRPSRVMRSAA